MRYTGRGAVSILDPLATFLKGIMEELEKKLERMSDSEIKTNALCEMTNDSFTSQLQLLELSGIDSLAFLKVFIPRYQKILKHLRSRALEIHQERIKKAKKERAIAKELDLIQ